MFFFQIHSLPQSFLLDETKISALFSAVSNTVELPQNGEISIAFVSETAMQELNAHHRHIDAPTDVLSFHYFDDFSACRAHEPVGECVFCEEKILSQARQYGHTPHQEFEILLIHSLLHILGYDHETDEDFEKMWKREQSLRKQFGLTCIR